LLRGAATAHRTSTHERSQGSGNDHAAFLAATAGRLRVSPHNHEGPRGTARKVGKWRFGRRPQMLCLGSSRCTWHARHVQRQHPTQRGLPTWVVRSCGRVISSQGHNCWPQRLVSGNCRQIASLNRFRDAMCQQFSCRAQGARGSYECVVMPPYGAQAPARPASLPHKSTNASAYPGFESQSWPCTEKRLGSRGISSQTTRRSGLFPSHGNEPVQRSSTLPPICRLMRSNGTRPTPRPRPRVTNLQAAAGKANGRPSWRIPE
jgi:hypothetical protein